MLSGSVKFTLNLISINRTIDSCKYNDRSKKFCTSLHQLRYRFEQPVTNRASDQLRLDDHRRILRVSR